LFQPCSFRAFHLWIELIRPGALFVRIIPSFAALIVASTLSACVTADSVELESRPISVNQNAEPAGAAGQVAAASVANLLPASGPTYVTLTVSEVDPNVNANKGDYRKSAITSGSGFLVSNDGYVMTAAHVAVAKGYEVSARAANGRVYTGTVIGILPSNDMAVIRLRGFTGRSAVPAAPGCMGKGDLVYTLGKPHGEGDTARVGALEAKHFGRAVAYGKFGYPDALVLHMGTQKGESGGPVFDGNGHLIGMVVSTLSDTNGQSINLAHAIPSTALANFLCSQTSCSGVWSGLAVKNMDACG
jgi:S1-C subfamily serine protease